MHEDSFSGWGVRTLSNTGARYNPMSYHNGSVWPHDNAMIAYGLSRCGFKEPANTLFQGLFSAAMHFDLQRLPELFCGFDRAEGYGPVRYPIACAPQAWAAGSASLFLQASLGIEVDGVNGRIIFHQPTLPAFLDEIKINGLVVGGNKIDLTLRGRGLDVNVRAEGDSGTTEIIIKP
jgi:glycogen debranching enzyme